MADDHLMALHKAEFFDVSLGQLVFFMNVFLF